MANPSLYPPQQSPIAGDKPVTQVWLRYFLSLLDQVKGFVTQSGSVTPGNLAIWTADQTIGNGPSPSALGITQLTGDVLAGPGSGSQVATLSTTGVTAGTYGDGSHVSQVTVDAKGRLTSVADVAIDSNATLIGLLRLLGDGVTTVFNLVDLADYLVAISDAGAVVDPATYTLSADQVQVTFASAPGAGNVLTFEYVVALS